MCIVLQQVYICEMKKCGWHLIKNQFSFVNIEVIDYSQMNLIEFFFLGQLKKLPKSSVYLATFLHVDLELWLQICIPSMETY